MIFLGCLFEREKEKEYIEKSKCAISNAANGFQWNILDGFNLCTQETIRIFNVLPVGVFPLQYKELFLKSRKWNYKEFINFEIGSINLPFIKQWQRYRKCKKLLSKIGDKNIIIYSAYLPFLKAVYKLDESYNITAIITDLPEYYDLGKTSRLKKFFRNRNNKKIEKYIKRVDKFVLLTKQMNEKINLYNKPFIVVEGVCNQTISVNAKESDLSKDNDKKTILYTGTIFKRFGIGNLLEAFQKIESQNYRLVICGGGDMEDEILEACRRDCRIQYLGFVSKEKIVELQKEATVLVNPRQNNDEFTKYSFPSKTMEYMLSGKPIIMYKLDGIPDEYDEYLHYVENDSVEALKNKLVEVCEQSEEARDILGKRAQQFVSREKSAKRQVEKIINLIDHMA